MTTLWQTENLTMVPCVAFDVKHEGRLYLEGRCPTCGRFLNTRAARVSFNFAGHIDKVLGCMCAVHGEVTPHTLGWF